MLPSFREGIPVSLMEASAYRIPSIASDVGGVGELLGDGAGILVPPGEVEALAQAIEKLARDPVLRRQLGNAARVKVERAFDVRQTTAALLRLIDEFGSPGPHRQPTSYHPISDQLSVRLSGS